MAKGRNTPVSLDTESPKVISDIMQGVGWNADANWFTDKALRHLTYNHIAIRDVIRRKTLGWSEGGNSAKRKSWDSIAYAQFQEYTGLDTNDISDTIKALVRYGLILKGRCLRKGQEYRLQFNERLVNWEALYADAEARREANRRKTASATAASLSSPKRKRKQDSAITDELKSDTTDVDVSANNTSTNVDANPSTNVDAIYKEKHKEVLPHGYTAPKGEDNRGMVEGTQQKKHSSTNVEANNVEPVGAFSAPTAHTNDIGRVEVVKARSRPVPFIISRPVERTTHVIDNSLIAIQEEVERSSIARDKHTALCIEYGLTDLIVEDSFNKAVLEYLRSGTSMDDQALTRFCERNGYYFPDTISNVDHFVRSLKKLSKEEQRVIYRDAAKPLWVRHVVADSDRPTNEERLEFASLCNAKSITELCAILNGEEIPWKREALEEYIEYGPF